MTFEITCSRENWYSSQMERAYVAGNNQIAEPDEAKDVALAQEILEWSDAIHKALK